MAGKTTTGKAKWTLVPSASGPSVHKMSPAAMKRVEITTGVLKPKQPSSEERHIPVYEAPRIPPEFDAAKGTFRRK